MSRVLICCPNSKIGGAEKAAFSQFRYLDSIIDCKLLYLFSDYEVEKLKGIITLSVSIREKIKAIFVLYFVLRKENPSIVMCHLSAYIYVGLCSILTRRKLIYFIHTDPKFELSGFKGIISKFLIRVTNTSVMVLNAEYKQWCEEKLDIATGIFLNIVTLQPIRPTKYSNKCVLIARADPVKRIELVNDLADLCPQIEFLVFTSKVAQFAPYYESLHETLHEKENVELYTGISCFEEIADIAQGSRVCLSLSKYEGLPTVIIECASLSIVPLGLDNAGVSNILRPLEICLSETLLFQDIDRLAKSIRYFCGMEESEFKNIAFFAGDWIEKNYGSEVAKSLLEELVRE